MTADDLSREARDIVIVFGGAGGLGTALCKQYLESGSAVIICDKNRIEDPPLKARLDKDLFYFAVDVTVADSLRQASIAIAEQFKRATHLVSLAGGALPGEFEGIGRCEDALMRSSIELNLTSHLNIIHAFLPLLIDDPASNKSVTLISSINAVRDYGCPAYSAAKAGMLGLVRSACTELGRLGIRINAAVPGTVPTPRTLAQPKNFDALRRQTALNRFPTPEEMAKLVHALSHILTCVTGQDIIADCGQTLKAGTQ